MDGEAIDPEILRDFASETRENMARMETHLLTWERGAIGKDEFDDMFRSVHNLKGTCGFLGFRTLEELAHQMESALSAVRDKLSQRHQQLVSLLIKGLDAVETILKQVEISGEDHFDTAALMASLLQLGNPELASGEPEPVMDPIVPSAPAAVVRVMDAVQAPVGEVEHPDWTLDEADLPISEASVPTKEESTSDLPETVPPLVETGTSQPSTYPGQSSESDHGFDDQDEPVAATEAGDLRGDFVASSIAMETAGSTVRVPKGLLDGVLELVSQLALSRNLILHKSRANGNRSDIQHAIQLHRITNELESQVLKLRLQPLRVAFAPLSRLVRDTALACGKKVRLEIDGQETETDRVIIETIRDPLQHLVRNSIDHGIESPAERTARGKLPEGVVRIVARYDGGRVIIEVEDDGGGLNVDKIKEKAVRLGLATQEQIQAMTTAQIQQFIFRPGFSTASKVSMISGRGVGLDIVKRNLERISASVEVSSSPGLGTRFKIITNRALVTVSALVVEVSGIRFAIMHSDLVKVMRIHEKEMDQLVRFEGGRFLRADDGLLALIELRSILHLPPKSEEEGGSKDILAILVSNGEQRFGLVVDDAHDSEEIIVKPLGKYLTRMDHYKGVAILEDGGLVLILNIAPMLRLVDFESLEGVITRDYKRHTTLTGLDKTPSLEENIVLCQVVPRGLLAVRLEEVLRLEELDPRRVEAEGEAESAQYWGEVLRLVPVQRLLVPNVQQEELWRSKEMIPVIVIERSGALFGLVVTAVLDIVKVKLKLVREDVRPGLFGTILVNGQIVELIDSHGLIEMFEQGKKALLE